MTNDEYLNNFFLYPIYYPIVPDTKLPQPGKCLPQRYSKQLWRGRQFRTHRIANFSSPYFVQFWYVLLENRRVERNRVFYFHALLLSGIKRLLSFSRSFANCSKKWSSSISSARVSKCTALVASGTSSRRASFWRASLVFLEILIFILCFVVAIEC